MTKFWDKIQQTVNKIGQTSLCFVKVIFFSRRVGKVQVNFCPKDEIVVLGNGPSLLNTIGEKKYFLQDKDLLAVNFAVASDYFEHIRPNLYVAVDPAFFQNEEYCEKLFGNLERKTRWPLLLFLPIKARNNANWKSKIAENKWIEVCFINTTPVEGFSFIVNYLYKCGLGMPRPRNVLIPAIMQALRLNYQAIYVAGADHSWPRQVAVDDQNRVYEDLRHFYSENEAPNRHYFTNRLDEILESMVVAFRSYHALEQFSRSIGKKIYNITEGSYIDAFERKKI